ncbi:MAG: PD-(D/E)XK nuclease family protein [Bryobacteraceae bacterium]
MRQMRLLIGPAGSGKTTRALDSLRAALRRRESGTRLLVPTATLAMHLENQLAREGLVFRPSAIQTLHGFVEASCSGLVEVTDPVLALVAAEAIRRVNRAEFAGVAGMAGFHSQLARTVTEFASAGCDAARLEQALAGNRLAGEAPLAHAFTQVYREVERLLDRAGMALRARRLERAAERIAAEGLAGVESVWLDGFHALPAPELRVVAALAAHADVTITLAEGEAGDGLRTRLGAMGFAEERLPARRGAPARLLVRAPSVERESEEIARRILQQTAAGRPFREIGVIVRSAENYVPLLRTTLERFGIPARFYFDQPLGEHPVSRFLVGALRALKSGWDWERTLAAVRLAPRFAESNAADRWDFAVREKMPGSGLAGLRELARECGAERLVPLLERMRALEEWQLFTLSPRDWAARFAELTGLVRPLIEERIRPQTALEYRAQAVAMHSFEEAAGETAAALCATADIPGREPDLAAFQAAFETVMARKPLRLPDGRRNVVHVLPAFEAREWALPVVFVCGLVEKQFPRLNRPDPFFPDAARRRLGAAGIGVRSGEDFEREERALFDAAISRATVLATVTYPEFDERGEPNLRSLYLEDLPLAEETARPARPRPARVVRAPSGKAVAAPALLAALGQRTAKLSPTALETYLNCPFQYFARQTLRLGQRPESPEKRLDFLTQGNIVHSTLKRWYSEGGNIAALFEAEFAAVLEDKNIPLLYHTERLRNQIRDDLQVFANDGRWRRQDFASRMEEVFEFQFDETLVLRGKIDRLDTAPDGRAYVVDYKYSNPATTRGKLTDENLLQAPLYAMAARERFGVRVAGVFYLGLKKEVKYAGWSEDGFLDSLPMRDDWLAAARQKTLRVVNEIRSGRVEPDPADPAKCRQCDYRDACRFRSRQAAVEGAAE